MKTFHNIEKCKLAISEYLSSNAKIQDIADKYGVHRGTLSRFMTEYGYPHKQPSIYNQSYTFDEGVFDTINENSAYWIGFLLADGCVYQYKNQSPQIKLDLAKIDREHIGKFLAFLKSDRPIHNGYNGRASCSTCISSCHIAEVLKQYGVTQRKSFTAEAPNALIGNRDFWRGLVDGDGTVGWATDKTTKSHPQRPVIRLNGTSHITSSFSLYMKSVTGNEYHPTKYTSIFKVSSMGRPAYQIIKNLYCGASIYLDRKYHTAMEIIEKYDGLCLY